MMAETIVENKVCNACGAAVRKDALFCYHCGGQVAADIAMAENEKVKTVVDNFDQSANGTNFDRNGDAKKEKVRETLIEEPPARVLEQLKHKKEEIELKSAATMRKNPKSIQPKKIEVIWEERENTPNVWFIMVTIFLTIVAGVILFLAIRLR